MWSRIMIPLWTIPIYCNAFIRCVEHTDYGELTDCVSCGICGAHRRCGRPLCQVWLFCPRFSRREACELLDLAEASGRQDEEIFTLAEVIGTSN